MMINRFVVAAGSGIETDYVVAVASEIAQVRALTSGAAATSGAEKVLHAHRR